MEGLVASNRLEDAQMLVAELEGLGYSFAACDGGWEVFGHGPLPEELSEKLDEYADEFATVLTGRMTRHQCGTRSIH